MIQAERDTEATEEFLIILSIHLLSAYCVPRSMLRARNSRSDREEPRSAAELSVTLCDPSDQRNTPSGLTLRLGLGF